MDSAASGGRAEGSAQTAKASPPGALARSSKDSAATKGTILQSIKQWALGALVAKATGPVARVSCGPGDPVGRELLASRHDHLDLGAQ